LAELTALVTGAIAVELGGPVAAVSAFPAACHALEAIVWIHFPLHEKPILHASDVVVPISTENGHDCEEAALRDAAMDAVARELPAVAEPDEGTVVAGQAMEPSRVRRRRTPRALAKEEQLLIGSAEDERPGREERDVHRRRWAAGVEREVVVHHMEGFVAGEDAEHLVRLVHGFGQERAVAAALELEGRRSARRLAGLLQPERVGDVELPACLGPAA